VKTVAAAAGHRCTFAEELGGVKEAAEWANDAMRWFVEEALRPFDDAQGRRRSGQAEALRHSSGQAGGMNEVLSKAGRGFAGRVFGKREELVEGGLDEALLGRFVEAICEGEN